MVEYYDFAKKLRSLARRADTFNHSRQQILEELIAVAENYEAVGERLELEMIIQLQQDMVENDLFDNVPV
jgi:hypothetical protein